MKWCSSRSHLCCALDFMNGLSPQIWTERDRRLEAARTLRAQRRAQLHDPAFAPQSAPWRKPVLELASPFCPTRPVRFTLDQDTAAGHL